MFEIIKYIGSVLNVFIYIFVRISRMVLSCVSVSWLRTCVCGMYAHVCAGIWKPELRWSITFTSQLIFCEALSLTESGAE